MIDEVTPAQRPFAGYAGPAGRKAAEVISKYLISDMYAKPANVLADDDRSMDEGSLAHVVRGILDLAGLKFDVDGRLI